MKAGNVVAPQKAPKAAPDFEEAIEEEDDGEIVLDEPGDVVDEDVDLSKDKYIKKPRAPKDDGLKKATAKKGKKAAKRKENNEDESEEEIKPKSSRGGKGSGPMGKSKK